MPNPTPPTPEAEEGPQGPAASPYAFTSLQGRAAFEWAKANGFDLVPAHRPTPSAAELSRLKAEVGRLKGALKAVFAVGDGWGGDNTVQKPKGTTGDGHARCREIARAALGDET